MDDYDPISATPGERRRYNRWVANETMEDFALRFTARRARSWSYRARREHRHRVRSRFWRLRRSERALTLTYGFDIAMTRDHDRGERFCS